MATIQENRKNGKLVSYKFTACVGRDAAGKQIRYYRTWTPPREYAPARARKCAQLEAAQWEQAIRKHGTNSAQVLGSAAARRAEKTDFCAFITDTWLPIQVCNGSKKPKTEDFYKSMTKLICKYFDGWFLQDIRPIDIQKYLIYLRTEYTGKSGKPLTAKNTFASIQHIASDFQLRRTAGAHFKKSDAQSGRAEERNAAGGRAHASAGSALLSMPA